MNTLLLSDGFQRLYCDATVFETFSAFNPISFKRVLPFQQEDRVVDDPRLIDAEAAHLADKNDNTRRAVVDAYAACGLLSQEDTVNLRPVLDFYDGQYSPEFFDLMGLVYANAGMDICALRWYREHIAILETQNCPSRSDEESVYASVGHSLYSLGMFEEAIAWTKSCIGPRAIAFTLGRALVSYEAQKVGGDVFAIERSANRVRYTIKAPDPGNAPQIMHQLKDGIKALGLFGETYIDWKASTDRTSLPMEEGYPFRLERDSSCYMRHKMNLLFATAGRADALLADGCDAEARRLLFEAALLEPKADFIQERIAALP